MDWFLYYNDLRHERVRESFRSSKIPSTGGVLVDLFNKTDFAVSKLDLLSMGTC